MNKKWLLFLIIKLPTLIIFNCYTRILTFNTKNIYRKFDINWPKWMRRYVCVNSDKINNDKLFLHAFVPETIYTAENISKVDITFFY